MALMVCKPTGHVDKRNEGILLQIDKVIVAF